jgi:hypothetical protein
MWKLKIAAAVTLVLLACTYGSNSPLPVPVTDSGKDGFINLTGKIVIQPQFAQARGFSDGLALVNVGGTVSGSGPILAPKSDHVSEENTGRAPPSIRHSVRR